MSEKLVEMEGKAGRVVVTENEVSRMTNKGYKIAKPGITEDRTKKAKKTKKEKE